MKKEGRGHNSVENSEDASIQRLEDNIKVNKKTLTRAANNSNSNIKNKNKNKNKKNRSWKVEENQQDVFIDIKLGMVHT